mmetsp:Transcript_6899/g.7144  ORF Transcript_6899/g.7144 Transcript_6899/m.7144 type:complete len:351 (+) Transcript_6899:264-1316(+)
MDELKIVGVEGHAANPMSFPAPIILQCTVHAALVNDEEKSVLISESGSAYEVNRVIKEAIYGEVRVGFVLNKNLDGISFQRTSTIVAIKIYLKSRLVSFANRVQENPMREIAAMCYLQSGGEAHPNIVRMIECLKDEHRMYSILEYYDGGELFDVIDEDANHGRLTEKLGRARIRQILNGIVYLQKIGICHRDMSLENLLLCRDGRVVIIDFGMCLRVPVHPDTGAVYPMPPQGRCGKINYMSPEVFENNAPFNGLQSDMWSVGVILFIMLVGVPPMDFPSMGDARYVMILNGQLGDMLEHWGVYLSAEAIDLLQRMLNRNPSERLTVEQIMEHPWMKLDEFMESPIEAA